MNTSEIEIRPSPLVGRGLFSKSSISAGEPILSLERPLIALLDEWRIQDTCAWCFAWTELPVLPGAGINQTTKVSFCTGCKKVKYCSKKCQSFHWKEQHKRECKIFGSQPQAIPNTVVAVMQILQGIDSSDVRYKAVLELESHSDEFHKSGGQRWETIQLMAFTALKFIGQNKSAERVRVSELVTCIVMCNSSRLVTTTFDPLGISLDPLIARINHSCSPNAIVVYDGAKLSLRALDRINSGGEVFISYIDNTAPYGVRQAELQDQYFFTCSCSTCKLKESGPQDGFRKFGPEWEQRISAIDQMIPELKKDPAWSKHSRGSSKNEQRLSALQFYAYSFLQPLSAQPSGADLERLRKIITICRNSEVYPIERAPLPAIYQQYAVACLASRRYNEALIAFLRIYSVIDKALFPQSHHPVRVVHAWTLATLAKAVGSEQDSPFCQALQASGVDLSMLFIGLLVEAHEKAPKSHGKDSLFAKQIEETRTAMLGPGGELDLQYREVGITAEQWRSTLASRLRALMSRVENFAKDDKVATELDQAMQGQ